MDCRLPGSSVHGIFWARILEWVAIPFSRASSPSRDQAHVSFTTEPPGKSSAVKNPPAMQEVKETQIRSLNQEDPLEKEMATHSSVLA